MIYQLLGYVVSVNTFVLVNGAAVMVWANWRIGIRGKVFGDFLTVSYADGWLWALIQLSRALGQPHEDFVTIRAHLRCAIGECERCKK